MPSGVVNAVEDGRDAGFEIRDRARVSEVVKPVCCNSIVELGSGGGTDCDNRQFVPGSGIDGALRTYRGVAIQIIAEAPWQRDARVDIEAPSVVALVAEKINRLGVVIGKHQVVEQLLAP